jgi:hypothetical protein
MFKLVNGKVVLNNPYKLKRKRTGHSSKGNLHSLKQAYNESNADILESGIGSRMQIINKDYRDLLGDNMKS